MVVLLARHCCFSGPFAHRGKSRGSPVDLKVVSDLYNYIFHFPYLIFPQIAKIVKALLERNVIYGNPDEAFGMLPDVKEEIKEEPQEDVEVTQVGIFNI